MDEFKQHVVSWLKITQNLMHYAIRDIVTSTHGLFDFTPCISNCAYSRKLYMSNALTQMCLVMHVVCIPRIGDIPLGAGNKTCCIG